MLSKLVTFCIQRTDNCSVKKNITAVTSYWKDIYLFFRFHLYHNALKIKPLLKEIQLLIEITPTFTYNLTTVLVISCKVYVGQITPVIITISQCWLFPAKYLYDGYLQNLLKILSQYW